MGTAKYRNGKARVHKPKAYRLVLCVLLGGWEVSDSVNHPPHYNDGKIEVIEFIEDKNLGFHLANAVKYISRAGKKDASKEVEGLKKAIWYIERRLELFENKPRRPNDMH